MRAGTVDTKKDEMIALIAKKTKNYAKRQLIFLRSFEKQLRSSIIKNNNLSPLLEPELVVANLTLLDLDLYIDHQIEKFSNYITMPVDV